MKTLFLLILLASAAGLRADGLPGKVSWSDGRTAEGTVSLTQGKDFHLFVAGDKAQTVVRFEDVRSIEMIPEKEEIREGFAFVEPGQARTEKTGEVYPTRSFLARLTLRDGTVKEGHLATTVLYIEDNGAVSKAVLLAKQTGKIGQKLEDLAYPTQVSFGGADTAASLRLDLSQAGLTKPGTLTVAAKPDLSLLAARPEPGNPLAWTVPLGDAGRVLFAVECADGLHVAWPVAAESTPGSVDAARAVETSFPSVRDFYDTVKLEGCFLDPDKGDVYTIVLFSRTATTHSFEKGKEPWSRVLLRWKYDPDEKRTTLLNRTPLETGRETGNAAPPPLIKDEALLSKIAPLPPKPGAAP